MLQLEDASAQFFLHFTLVPTYYFIAQLFKPIYTEVFTSV